MRRRQTGSCGRPTCTRVAVSRAADQFRAEQIVQRMATTCFESNSMVSVSKLHARNRSHADTTAQLERDAVAHLHVTQLRHIWRVRATYLRDVQTGNFVFLNLATCLPAAGRQPQRDSKAAAAAAAAK